MAFDASQLATLEAAAASGHLTVQLGDRRIQYQTLAELLKALAIARVDVANATAATRQTRRYAEYGRGY